MRNVCSRRTLASYPASAHRTSAQQKAPAPHEGKAGASRDQTIGSALAQPATTFTPILADTSGCRRIATVYSPVVLMD